MNKRISTSNFPNKQTRHRCLFRQRCLGALPAATGSDSLPPWQRERMAILQRACERVKRLAARHGLLKSIRMVAGNLNGRWFKSDPCRALKLSPKTLTERYYAWRAAGETAAAFRFKYSCRHALFRSLVMAKFADFLIAHPHRSFESNWNIFSSRPSNFRGGWRTAERAIKASLTKADEIKARVQAGLTFQN
ncbi:MAG TPA: hypothetical protein VMH87_07810 [Pseudomonadales bacterium]|nr:hypothetical protein [Pseudomonadales bacterium]